MRHAADVFALSPAIQLHLLLALTALALGPVVLGSRKGSRVHRSLGYVWVLAMLGAALSSLFIRDFRLPNLAGYTPIHLLTVASLVGVTTAIVAALQRRISVHRKAMWQAYLGGCVGAGAFALLPGRYLGDLVWHHALGWV